MIFFLLLKKDETNLVSFYTQITDVGGIIIDVRFYSTHISRDTWKLVTKADTKISKTFSSNI